MTEQFYVGLIIEGKYPNGLVDWCNSQKTPTTIKEIEPKEDGTRRFQVIEIEQPPIPLVTEEQFLQTFFEIPNHGWFRRVPRGYQSAVESVNTAFNAVNIIGGLPEGYLTFYTKPDFTDETQCTQEWILNNKYANGYMTKEQFGEFYIAFMTGWNAQEHKGE